MDFTFLTSPEGTAEGTSEGPRGGALHMAGVLSYSILYLILFVLQVYADSPPILLRLFGVLGCEDASVCGLCSLPPSRIKPSSDYSCGMLGHARIDTVISLEHVRPYELAFAGVTRQRRWLQWLPSNVVCPWVREISRALSSTSARMVCWRLRSRSLRQRKPLRLLQRYLMRSPFPSLRPWLLTEGSKGLEIPVSAFRLPCKAVPKAAEALPLVARVAKPQEASERPLPTGRLRAASVRRTTKQQWNTMPPGT